MNPPTPDITHYLGCSCASCATAPAAAVRDYLKDYLETAYTPEEKKTPQYADLTHILIGGETL